MAGCSRRRQEVLAPTRYRPEDAIVPVGVRASRSRSVREKGIVVLVPPHKRDSPKPLCAARVGPPAGAPESGSQGVDAALPAVSCVEDCNYG
jgi:hypothetical protein